VLQRGARGSLRSWPNSGAPAEGQKHLKCCAPIDSALDTDLPVVSSNNPGNNGKPEPASRWGCRIVIILRTGLFNPVESVKQCGELEHLLAQQGFW